MRDLLNLEKFPLNDLSGTVGRTLVAQCQDELSATGMFNLHGLLRPDAITRSIAELIPRLTEAAYTHVQDHNIYFKNQVDGLPANHPALKKSRTSNRKICTDQMKGFIVRALYEWPPFAAFLAAVMAKPALYIMDDPLAGLNVMAYRDGETLNWHFDRSEFTTTLLIQAPEAGGDFQYRSDLRTKDDPNYDGVARLLSGDDPDLQTVTLDPGTLNVFRGKNTAHRVTTVRGDKDRIIAVFSFFDRPGVRFSDEDRVRFYGRAR